MLPPRTSLPGLVNLVVPLAFAAGLAGQDSLPPAPTGPLVLPEHTEAVLPGGLRLVVVPDEAARATTYTLLIPGGGAADPVGLEGTASAVAAAMQERSGAGDPRITVAFGASGDAIAGTVVDSTGNLGRALSRLASAVLEPRLTPRLLDTFRSRRTAELRTALEQPDFLAFRSLAAALYGDHPYGRSADSASLARLDVERLEAWRGAFSSPAGAVLTVAGPVDPASVRDAVLDALSGWEGDDGPREHPARSPLRQRAPPWLLVHEPASASATIHLGIALPPGTSSDWTTIAVLDQILGGDAESRLFRVEGPDGRGIVVGAASAAQRRVGPGLFHVRASVQTGRAAAVTYGLLAELEAIGRESVGPEPLRRARERLASTFPQQLQTAEGVAALMGVNRIFGLPDEQLTSYVERVRRVSAQDVREAAAAYLDTARVAVVVVGDATLLHEDLAALGPFEVVDTFGRAVDVDDLEAPQDAPEVDTSPLRPVEAEYRILVGGQEAGTASRSVARAAESATPGRGAPPGSASTWIYRSSASMGGQDIAQSVTFSAAGFQPLAATASIASGGQSVRLDATVEDGVLRGSVTSPEGRQELQSPVPPGTLVGDMLELAAALLAPSGPAAYRVSVTALETAEVEPVVLRVGEAEEVSVPAGTFTAVPVQVGGQSPQTIWVSADPPHLPLRIRPSGQPITLELVSSGPGGG